MYRVHHKFSVFALLTAIVLAGLSAGPLQAQSRDGFLKAFRKAIAENDFAGQRKLVGDNKDAAFNGFFDIEVDLLRARVAGETENANKQYDCLTNLSSNYKLEFKDDFLSERLRFVNSLEGENAATRIDANNAYWNGAQSYNEGRNGNEAAFESALQSYSNSFLASYKIKDFYIAAKSAEYISAIYKTELKWFKSAYYAKWCKRCAIEGGISTRDEFAWIDSFLTELEKENRVVKTGLIDINIGDVDEAEAAHVKAANEADIVEVPGGGGDGDNKGPVVRPPTAKAEYVWTDFKFKNTTEKNVWTKIKLPYYNNRAVDPQNGHKHPFYQYQVFHKVDKDKPEPSDFHGLPGGKILYDGDFNFTTDADKKNAKVKNRFDKLALDVKYDDGEKLEITHMMMDYESTRLELFGEKFTASDAAKTALVAWYGTTASTGKIFGHDITIIDTNGNGLIRDAGEDSIIIGKGRNARVEPFGRYVFLPEADGWYPYEIKAKNKIGTDITVRPFKGALAPIHVKYETGPGKHMPEYLVAKGTGADVEFYFDLMKGLDPAKPIWVPEGGYEIYQGYFSFGSGKKETNILIGKGRSPLFKVESGKLNTWELGSAGERGFWMIGDVRRNPEDKDELIAVGKEIQVFGCYGEQYFNFYEERVQPVVTIHRDGAEGKKVGKEEEMRMPGGSGLTLAELWFPANCTIKNAPKNAELWAQLTAKHGILGEIKSEWFRVTD